MKKCTICKEQKPTADFNKKSAAKDGLQPACRDCSHERFKAYYAKNHEKQIAVVKARNERMAQRNKEWLAEYFKTHPCVDCGETDIRVLEFDHLADKSYSVAAMVRYGYSIESIQAEIAKCEVRCRNDHARKTYERLGGSWHDKFLDVMPVEA